MNAGEEHAMIETLVLKEVYEEIESLPRQCKAVFKLIFFHNMSNAQVAAKLNIPVKAVLKYKQQAFALLHFTVLKQCLVSIPELTSFC
jgi:RNA polymerase sigma-70 factor (ECF subfamily)